MKTPAGPYSIGSDHWPGLSKLIEECGEVLQTAGKLIATNGQPGHWEGSNLHERLAEELADLCAAIEFVVSVNALIDARLTDMMDQRIRAKLAQFRRWHQEQSR